jgi:large subunit ribosomal protein L7Ae
MSEFIKFSVPEDLRVLQDETIKKLSKSGKIKIGINEVTKTIERGNAKFVLIAEDVSPAEIVMHIPIISKEKKIPFSYAKTKEDLGKMVGISAKASCVAITDAGSMQKELTTLIDKIEEVSGGKKAAVKTEDVKKEKPAPKKEEEVKKETPKEEKPENKEEVKKENKE